ncbi:methylenetetrahydrofolate reductase [Buchnera aphidicola (Mindarus keteleerifoliae)]|uniref:methylenetetrahydrofolate reductase n=1 Tax=Buchnera aphidicola TaxID=9 RepID=UPI0031B6D718
MNNLMLYKKNIFLEKFSKIAKDIQISFELFPPKKSFLEEKLLNVVKNFKLFKPKFFSVTHGANSGKENLTYSLVKKIKKKTGINTAPHLTCSDFTKFELKNIAKKYWNNKIYHIVALRGDEFNNSSRSKMGAIDLVYLLKKIANFDISVAAYPEVHPKAESAYKDLMNLKNKMDAGANRAITQFFFKIEHYLRFRDKCFSIGIKKDIVPGILPIYSYDQLIRFSKLGKVAIPKWIKNTFKNFKNDVDICKIIGSNIMLEMVYGLYREGVRNFHFYTLNRLEIVYSICCILNQTSF